MFLSGISSGGWGRRQKKCLNETLGVTSFRGGWLFVTICDDREEGVYKYFKDS